MLQLPFATSDPNYRMTVVIAGTPYIFNVHWNGRDAAWYFDLLTSDETVIYAGIKIVLGTMLALSRMPAAGDLAPLGAFMVVDTSGQDIDATLDDINSRVLVLFADIDDLNEITSG